jgi:hypothetical protein
VQSIGTTWGLFRHFWVLAKLVLTSLVTVLLFLHTRPIDHLATAARDVSFSNGDFLQVRIQLLANAAAVVLLIATVLSVFKPRGLTRYGWRKQLEDRSSSSP